MTEIKGTSGSNGIAKTLLRRKQMQEFHQALYLQTYPCSRWPNTVEHVRTQCN